MLKNYLLQAIQSLHSSGSAVPLEPPAAVSVNRRSWQLCVCCLCVCERISVITCTSLAQIPPKTSPAARDTSKSGVGAFISIHNSKHSCSRLYICMWNSSISIWLPECSYTGFMSVCVHCHNTQLQNKDNVHRHMCSLHHIQTLVHFAYKAR